MEWGDYMEEADRHCLGPGHPVEVGGLEADKVYVFSGDLLLDLLHGWSEPLIPKDLDSLVSVICGKEFEVSAKTLDNQWLQKSIQ